MEKKLGGVEDYFAHVGVVALKLKGDIKVGETIRVRGHTTDFTQTVVSMQIDHVPVQEAKKGQDVGIKVIDRARKTDTVYKVLPDVKKSAAAKKAAPKKKPAAKKKTAKKKTSKKKKK
ncbi:MAG: hypothetical protein JW803_04510 [Endomicrobiales bacterium]|nr:hypothetical protein [Endomicrobiales bacterium]